MEKFKSLLPGIMWGLWLGFAISLGQFWAHSWTMAESVDTEGLLLTFFIVMFALSLLGTILSPDEKNVLNLAGSLLVAFVVFPILGHLLMWIGGIPIKDLTLAEVTKESFGVGKFFFIASAPFIDSLKINMWPWRSKEANEKTSEIG